jgi:hypothetical protein
MSIHPKARIAFPTRRLTSWEQRGAVSLMSKVLFSRTTPRSVCKVLHWEVEVLAPSSRHQEGEMGLSKVQFPSPPKQMRTS